MAMEYFESIYWPLLADLQSRGIEVVIGGGMALYLRDLYLSSEGRSPDYPPRPSSRTTKDMDAFITREVLSEPDLFYKIPYVLKEVFNFQPIKGNESWQTAELCRCRWREEKEKEEKGGTARVCQAA